MTLIILFLVVCFLALAFYVGKCFIIAFKEQILHKDVPDDRTLDEKLADAEETDWSKEELNSWLNTLDLQLRNRVLAAAKRYAARGGDPLVSICLSRTKIEAAQKRNAAIEKANRPTLGGLMWAWDEAMKMGEERRFYQEQHERWQKEKKDKGW